jgi:predicted amidohydrolase YtcJ
MMRRRTLLLLFVSLLTFIAGGTGQDSGGPPADLVIRNARIFTVDRQNPRAEALAIKGEFILAAGTNRAMDRYVKPGETQVIDARGRLVIPGFNDAHAHYGAINPDYIDLRYVIDPDVITERVRQKVLQARPGELIRGGRWEHEMFANRQWPTKALLDKVAPDNPVVLSRADGHSVLVNSYVLKASGITRATPDPPGGEIQRDPVTAEPTGIFKESASRLLKYGAVQVQRTPQEQEARLMQGWQAALELAARLGVTSIQHPGGGDPQLYQRLKDMGKLTVRVDVAGSLTADDQRLKQYDELRKKYPVEGNWIRFGYLKGMMDGTLGSGTMMVFEPFLDAPGNTGLPQMPYEELERRVVAADKMGFQIGIHAIGPKANRWILDAYEKARQVNGKRDSRHRSEHAQILTDQDIPRFSQLGVIASMQPTHCITDKRFCEKRIGFERSKGAYAWRRLLNAGARLAFGTDYEVEPLDPLEGLYAAVTRKDRAGEPGDGWFPEQKLKMEEVIELYTLGSAYSQFMESRKGMLKKGYLADVVIMKDDLLSMPPDQIMKSKVDCTIVGGKVVYQREKN